MQREEARGGRWTGKAKWANWTNREPLKDQKKETTKCVTFGGSLATISGKSIVLELKGALDKSLSELSTDGGSPPRTLQSGAEIDQLP